MSRRRVSQASRPMYSNTNANHATGKIPALTNDNVDGNPLGKSRGDMSREKSSQLHAAAASIITMNGTRPGIARERQA